jgi:N-glycosylase/DNA lyase
MRQIFFFIKAMEFTLSLDSPFSLDYTLESGQVFRWENKGEWWYGVVSEGVVKVAQEGDSLRCVSSEDSIGGDFMRSYFRLDEDLQQIMASVMKDETLTQAAQRFYGMRLIRQEFWECLVSFVLATNSNIQRIKKMISSVCTHFGEPMEFEGINYFLFPEAERLAEASVKELRELGLGYRAVFLKRVAESVVQSRVDPGELCMMDYDRAHETLSEVLVDEKVLPGVGPKVADCILLYSCGKDEAFPIDVWIARVLVRSYSSLIGPNLLKRLDPEMKARLSRSDYARISAAARAYFGRYAGYAQQYLFTMARDEG